MAIKQLFFEEETELDNWVQLNYTDFFGKDVLFIPGNFFITTKRNKSGKPDGFILDFNNSSWTIIETELIKHGVWEHIAKQIMQFIVAAKNSSSQRKIRNMFLKTIEDNKLVKKISKQLDENESKLFKKIETIIENQTPDIAIFIDDINEDLTDMIEALNATVKVFKIQKYCVNGTVEYLAPEGNKAVIETTIEDVNDRKGNIVEALEVLGGGESESNDSYPKLYRLNDNSLVSFRYSKKYENGSYFWYGITPSTMEKYRDNKIDFLVFMTGNDGILKLPFNILEQYISQTNTTNNPDGSIKHYHILVKAGEKVYLYINQKKETWDVTDNYINFE